MASIKRVYAEHIDHLNLLDHSTGRRHSALTLTISESNDESSLSYFFHCGSEFICAFHVVSLDELVIEQAYTFHIPPRALDLGIGGSIIGCGNIGECK